MTKIFYIFIYLIYGFILFADNFSFNYKLDDKYNVTVKANVKIYLNNKYIGLNCKEIKVVMSIKDVLEKKYSINGSVYKLEKTLRNMTPVGYQIDKIESSDFNLFSNGNTESTNTSFPLFHNVPLFPDKKVETGDAFENDGKASVDIYTIDENKILPIIVYTKYMGKSDLYGIKYDLFEINYGYKNTNDTDISKAAGLHKIRFYFDGQNGVPVYMDDHFTEEFLLSDNKIIKKSGFYLFFYKPIIKMNKEEIIRDLTEDLIVKNNNLYKDLDFKKNEEGISITINNLKFKPDSTELIENEQSKIELLADMLKKIKNRSFVIVGHTALSGTKEEQYNLSLERAKTIKNILIEKGIEQQRLLYIGKGADEPIAPNDTDENRQKNRRVEIIVLED